MLRWRAIGVPVLFTPTLQI